MADEEQHCHDVIGRLYENPNRKLDILDVDFIKEVLHAHSQRLQDQKLREGHPTAHPDAIEDHRRGDAGDTAAGTTATLVAETNHLRDLLTRALPVVERVWGLETSGPRRMRWRTLMHDIQKAVPTAVDG